MARTVDVSKPVKPPTYRYVASTSRGQLVRGTVKATSEIAAERLIVEKGLNPVQVEVVPSMFSLEEALPTFFRVKPRDVIVFSRQLATLIKSGISLLPALEILHAQVGVSRAFRSVLGGVINDIRAGAFFSQAISKRPKAFNDIYCRTIGVGEETGSLETVLRRMADYIEKQSEVGQKIGKALTYPMMVLVVGVIVVLVLMTTVMPQLLSMFKAMNVALPLPTRILISASSFLAEHKVHLVIGGAVLGAVVLWMVKQPTGRRLLDRFRLAAPVLGTPALMWELSRFSRTMSVLVGAGLKLQDIMEMLPHSTSNIVFRDALNHVSDRLLMGEGLAEPMSSIKMFPPLMVQMVAVGEESNTLEFTMGVVADFYETAAQEKTSAMVAMLGPVCTIVIALLVGFIAISVIMPMYTLTGSLG